MAVLASPFTAATYLGGGMRRTRTWATEQVRRWMGGTSPTSSVQVENVPDGAIPAAAKGVSFVEVRPEGLAPMTLAYERHGSGEPVVLLHGLGSRRQAWDPVVPLLVAEREVITVDLPGFGESPESPACVPRDLPTVVSELGAVFTALGLERPHVVGHSLGGLIALRLAQAHLARSVIALAPAGFWNEAERRYAYAVLAAAHQMARLPDSIVVPLSKTPVGRVALTGTLYGRPELCPPDAVAASLQAMRQAAGFAATLRAGRAPDLFLGDIPGVPVTIAWGSGDHILPIRQAARAAAMIPGARMVRLPGCGHIPMNDTPEVVARIILQGTTVPPDPTWPRYTSPASYTLKRQRPPGDPDETPQAV
ncbi:alpha/beta fold hydrolase [Microtetraspora sp. AC03309]|uniref:alpha/beta fold hydrolase n=1 Tax=Microtetraspora sp. AC03309 TaxID=2779376 RepID=UPI001E4D0901|nr:alpha/beta fold hydrolase [Microtetraspora sp. AC03309]